jgi:hypothetical protein
MWKANPALSRWPQPADVFTTPAIKNDDLCIGREIGRKQRELVRSQICRSLSRPANFFDNLATALVHAADELSAPIRGVLGPRKAH